MIETGRGFVGGLLKTVETLAHVRGGLVNIIPKGAAKTYHDNSARR